MKPGWKTSEFFGLLFGGGMIIANAVFELKIPTEHIFGYFALAGGYTGARFFQKRSANGGDKSGKADETK